MNIKAFITPVAWAAFMASSHGQANDLDSLIRRAHDRSSRVKEAVYTVEARRATLSGASSYASPYVELGPGAGFTNGNSVLRQDVDLFGRRRASSRLAQADLKLAELGVLRARSEISQEMLVASSRYFAAVDEVASARTSLDSAKALQIVVAKQHEIGEAPKVHVTRAELDVVKAVQQLAQAEGRVKIAQAALNSLGGTDIDLQGVAWPKIESGSTVAIARSFELLEANQRVALVVAKTEVVRSEFDPSFSAGIAADVWSLDRNAFRRDNFGIQVLLSMPLFDSGQKRGALGASRSEVNAAKARVAEAQRIADLKLVEADAAFKTAQLVVTTYEGDVLPKGEALLTAMREGYSSGLVNLVEVLEAQQTLVKLRQERIQAVLTLRLAEVDLWRAQLALPGTEVPR